MNPLTKAEQLAKEMQTLLLTGSPEELIGALQSLVSLKSEYRPDMYRSVMAIIARALYEKVGPY